jgi:hypothetical protein
MAHSGPSAQEDGYERREVQETSEQAAQFEAQAKKKRREQGKMHRGAQFSEHRGRYSPFKPYTVKL